MLSDLFLPVICASTHHSMTPTLIILQGLPSPKVMPYARGYLTVLTLVHVSKEFEKLITPFCPLASRTLCTFVFLPIFSDSRKV